MILKLLEGAVNRKTQESVGVSDAEIELTIVEAVEAADEFSEKGSGCEGQRPIGG